MRFLPKTIRKRYLFLLVVVVLLLPLAGYWVTEIAPFRTWARESLAEQKQAALSIGMPVSTDDVLAQYTLPDGAVNAF
jgi:hypothetical protein